VSLLDTITKNAARSAEKAITDDKWFDKAVAKARETVPKDAADDDPLTKGARAATLQALDSLEKRRDDLQHLGVEGLTALMAHLSLGRLDDAARVYLAKGASLDELLAISAASNEEVLRRSQERQRAQKAALDVLKTIGSITARYVLPALLAAL
jgi:hypothetical protein